MLSFPTTNFSWSKNLVFDIYDSVETSASSTWNLSNLNLVGATLRTFPGSLTNISDIGYNRETKRFWSIQNNTRIMREYSQTLMISGSPILIREITWSGLAGSDTEGISDLIVNLQEGGYEVMVCEESAGGNRAYFGNFTSIMTGTINVVLPERQMLTMAPTATDLNDGAEGVTFNVWDQYITTVQEGSIVTTDREFFSADRPVIRNVDYTFSDPELTVTNPFNSQGLLPTSPRADQSSVVFHQGTGNYLILSQTTQTIFQVSITRPGGPGTIISTLDISSAGMFQPEGLCFFGDDLFVCGETDEYIQIPYVAP